MIAKIKVGTNHGNCLDYQEKEDSELISTNCASNDYQKIGYEMDAVSASNPRCKNNVVHISMSAPKGEHLTNEQWAQASQITLRELGFTDNQQVTTKHNDSQQEHAHITVNRIDSQGKAWNDSKSFERSHAAMRTVEREMGLERIEDHQNTKDGRFENTKTALNDSLKASKGKGLEHFKGEMKAKGYTVIENKAKTGTVSGISIKNDETGKTYKASELRNGGYRRMEKDLNTQQKTAEKPSFNRENSGKSGGAAGKALAGGLSKSMGGMAKMPINLPKMPSLPTATGLIKSIVRKSLER